MNKAELEDAKKKILLCGRNQGEHKYISISKTITKTSEYITELLCTRCFKKTDIESALELLAKEL